MVKKKDIDKLSISFLMTPTGFEPVLPPWKGGVLTAWPRGQTGGEGGIWTLAPLARSTPLAGAPLQPLEYFPSLAPQVGLEPTTDRLTADCSTTELLRNKTNLQKMVGLNGLEPSTSRLSGVRSNQLSYRPIIFLERVKGIEPSSSAWKAEVLPLNYTRMSYGGGNRIWTGDRGFADLCLTTWLCCHNWARRIRTFAWRNQNPLPYRLAIAH
jgi:hypothetical protein